MGSGRCCRGAQAQQGFGQREVLRVGDLEVLRAATHQPRRQSAGLKRAGFVGDAGVAQGFGGGQGLLERAKAGTAPVYSACILNGTRWDIGMPDEYLLTLAEFGRRGPYNNA